MPHTALECQVSKMVNSDTCPRPTTGRRAAAGAPPERTRPKAVEARLRSQVRRRGRTLCEPGPYQDSHSTLCEPGPSMSRTVLAL
jgi:hypothetical protein